VSGSVFAYGQLMAELWADAESFLLIEQDIEVSLRALRQARHCRCEWSVSPYGGPSPGSLLSQSLGCTRFRSSLIRALPDAVKEANQINDAGTVVPPGHWGRVDCRLYSRLRGSGESIRTPHLHEVVAHHHHFQYGCGCGGNHA
jgi:hypothetical protein